MLIDHVTSLIPYKDSGRDPVQNSLEKRHKVWREDEDRKIIKTKMCI